MRPFTSTAATFLSTTEEGNPHMTLAEELMNRIADQTLTLNQRARFGVNLRSARVAATLKQLRLNRNCASVVAYSSSATP